MPQYDAYHETVKRALTKDGWTITHDQYVIQFGELRRMADLGAEKVIAAERGSRKIVVEIKVFGGESFVNDFHRATGQYGNYRSLLRRINPDRQLYLAISAQTYLDYFHGEGVKEIIADQQIKLIIFDHQREEIMQWID